MATGKPLARRLALVCCAALLVLAFGYRAAAAEDFTINVVLPLTGNAAFVGNGEKAGLDALVDRVNASGGLNGRQIHLAYHDDQTSPQVAVQLSNEIIASHPPVILGSTITAMCNAQAPLMASGPVMYCFSPGVHPPAGSFVFSVGVSTLDLARALVRYFRLKGWTRLAMITSTDASGQDAERGLNEVLALPENKSVTMVERAHFNPGDVTVAAQIERVKSAAPQALIAWTTGASLATIFKAVIQSGLDVPVATTNGNQSVAQLTQYASFLPKELYVPSGTFPQHDGVFKLDPAVEAAQHEMYAAFAAHNLPIDNQTGTPWDATMIVLDALRTLGTNATPAAIRQHIASLKGYPGVWGTYDFTKTPQRGLDVSNAIITRWSAADKRFVWASQPGGIPLAK